MTANARMIRESGRGLAPIARALRRAALLVAMLALVAQGSLLQIHWHWTVQAESTSPATGTSSFAGGQRVAPSDDGTVCPLCQELGLSGLWLVPPPFVWTAATAIAVVAAVAVAMAYAAQARSHDWRSRAPPAARD